MFILILSILSVVAVFGSIGLVLLDDHLINKEYGSNND
jgi:hypothetical protein